MLNKETKEKIITQLAKGVSPTNIQRDNSVSLATVYRIKDNYSERIAYLKERLATSLIDDRSASIIRQLEEENQRLKAEIAHLKEQLEYADKLIPFWEEKRKSAEILECKSRGATKDAQEKRLGRVGVDRKGDPKISHP